MVSRENQNRLRAHTVDDHHVNAAFSIILLLAEGTVKYKPRIGTKHPSPSYMLFIFVYVFDLRNV